ncbi:S8 family serine peptidase [Mesorhizobium sp. LHD-90]|uniref:S8 family serine peptidase n=1 Tax=Mesorhizobium sp. LHD-90 TaxID=3071414 RepID=UPI0027E1286F|nr:S8 family serine peptidase [Mesorhizobium sp. LHD-90]MDQ6432506.1 S8 family serine peptidase [Mesorhizobium sp. LHD-90]
MPYPSDPLFDEQWHLALIGDMPRVWDDYTGAGVSVGIYDSAIQYTHPEFAGRYDPSKHLVFEGQVYDAAYTGPAKDGNPHGTEHGTHVAGVIAAALDGKGSVGVAPGASLTGFDIFNPATALYLNMGTQTGLFAALAQGALLDVVNNSWTFRSSFHYTHNIIRPETVDSVIAGIWEDLAENGRSGLGTIVVKGSGNDYWSAQSIGLNVSRHAIVVGSVTDDGFVADYSNHGANVLVSAPAGYNMVTVDILGDEGWNWDGGGDNDYTNRFGGTSGAAPVVSGVAALMLEANKNLGWRDVRDILAMSATHTGSAIGAGSTGFENSAWVVNGADNWNGGGLHFHVNYGYGVVDAYNAVRMAEAWELFGAPRTSANEAYVEASGAANLAITGQPATYTLALTSDLVVERVDVTLRFVNSTFPALSAELIGPDGSVHPLLYYDITSINYTDVIWRFGVEGLRNVAAQGDWSIRVSHVSGNAGQLADVKFGIYGHAGGADDVYHFTDEFAAMASLDASRRLVADGDSGVDWLNMAALSGDIVLDLRAGASSTLDGGQFIQTDAGTLIENAVTGDGNDVIRANAADNKLHGGRGNDIYYVNGAGDGVFEKAGQGSDRVATNVSYALAKDSAVEGLRTTLIGGLAAIDLTGNAFAQTIIGNAGDNVLHDGGKGAADVMKGRGGNDTYRVFNAGDSIIEGAAEGAADRVTAAVDYVLKAGVAVEMMTTNGSTGTSGIDLTGNEFAQTIIGNAGQNTLKDGGGDGDLLRGMSGNDTYLVYSTATVIVETAAQGAADLVMAAVDYVLTAGAWVERLATNGTAGAAAIDLTGNELGQEVVGNAGANILDGKAGDDTMKGLAGNDTLFGGAGKDSVTFNTALDAASNVDTVADFSVADDTINLENAIFAALAATGALLSGYFRANATGTAQDSNDHVIYHTGTGRLFYDADANGVGVAVQFAVLSGNPAIGAADFVVI